MKPNYLILIALFFIHKFVAGQTPYCPAGQSPGPGGVICIDCADGLVSGEGIDICADSCSPGFSKSGKACYPCEFGTNRSNFTLEIDQSISVSLALLVPTQRWKIN